MKKVLAFFLAVIIMACAAVAEETTEGTIIEAVQDIPTTSFMFQFSFTFGLYVDHFSNMDDMTIAGINHAKMVVNGDENRIVKQCIYNLGAISQEEYDRVLQLMLGKYPTQEYSEATGVVYEFPAKCYGAYTSGSARVAEDATLKCEKYHQWLYYHTDEYGLGTEGMVLVDFSLLTNQSGLVQAAVITYTMLPAEDLSAPEAEVLPADYGL